MISAWYAAILALWICALTLNVVKARIRNKVAYGDGDVKELVIARSAHGNATETIPIALILLLCLELSGGEDWLLHTFGVTLVIGRVLHAVGILTKKMRGRQLGMLTTLISILALAMANIIALIN